MGSLFNIYSFSPARGGSSRSNTPVFRTNADGERL